MRRIALLAILLSGTFLPPSSQAIEFPPASPFEADTFAVIPDNLILVSIAVTPGEASAYPAPMYACGRHGTSGTGQLFTVDQNGTVQPLGAGGLDEFFLEFGNRNCGPLVR